MIRNLMLPTIVNRELDRMMNGLENHSVPSFVASDLIEHESGWEIQMDLPGLDRENVEIFVEQDSLVIKGERKAPTLAVNDRLLQRNRDFGQFEKRYRLSDQVNAEAISANMEHGVLILHLPKAERALPPKVEIKIE